jgi:hypothetical protein
MIPRTRNPNPIARLSGALHVDGGDLFATAGSEWDLDVMFPG